MDANSYGLTGAWAVVAAAGTAQRFGSPKMFMTVLGEPLLHRTLKALWTPGLLDGLVVVVPPDRLDDPRLLPPHLISSRITSSLSMTTPCCFCSLLSIAAISPPPHL